MPPDSGGRRRPARILVTNDDGPDAGGLATLVRVAAAAGREVMVAVADRDHSSSGTGLGVLFDVPVEARRVERGWPGGPVTATYLVGASPSAVVTLAMLGAFGPAPDLVLAGVNRGVNVARGLIHSSTVGAALTAAAHRVPAVAVSAAGDGAAWTGWLTGLIRTVLAMGPSWPADGALAVNLPERPAGAEAADGAALWCRTAESCADGHLVRVPRDGRSFSLTLSYTARADAEAGTDVAALAAGRAALTWLALPYAAAPRRGLAEALR